MSIKKNKTILKNSLVATGILFSLYLIKDNNQVQAATVTNQNQVVKIHYNGPGKVAVWSNYDDTKHITGNYLAPDTSWKSFKYATLDNDSKWYNLGGNQWIDGQYVYQNTPNSNTNSSNSNSKPATDSNNYTVQSARGTGMVNYGGAGKVAVWSNYDNSKKTTGNYLAKNTNWQYFKIATGNNKTWYNLGGNQWIDGQYFVPNKTYILPYTYYSHLSPIFAPSACEAVSLKIAMSVKGVGNNLSVKDIIDKMPKSNNPETGFNGNPYQFAGNKFVTIYPAPLASYAKDLGANAQNISGANEAELIKEVTSGNPVIVVCNLHMQYNAPYHVSTIVGYRPGEFLVADPYRYAHEDGKVFWVNINKFMNIYNSRGKGAVVIR